jgi:predicted transcriptional regulator of viral defense system
MKQDTLKGPTRKRAPVRKKIVVPRPKKVTATEEVLQVSKRHKRGINISRLKNKTGFADSNLRMIISRADKQGKIKRKARGVYVSA